VNVGDIVRMKTHLDVPSSVGLVVEISNPTSSTTYEVYVLWDFLDGKVGINYSYQLEVVK
jgi:hypothetical protein